MAPLPAARRPSVVVALFFHLADVRAAGGPGLRAVPRPGCATPAARWPTTFAGIIGGAIAPIISVALLDRFDTSIAVSVYAVAMLLVTIICVLLAAETSKIDLHADPAKQPTRSR